MFLFWNTAKIFVREPYNIQVSWAYEDTPIRDCFDDTVSDIADLERRCDAGIDTHFIVRVDAIYQGHEFASIRLGSCYASDCSPEDEIDSGFLAGYLEDMTAEVVAEADRELIRLNREIFKDIRKVDLETE